MPVFRFVGFHDPLANGKFLLEVCLLTMAVLQMRFDQILLQLRNFGKGRIVTKTEWQHRWPNSATFCRIVHVQPLMDRVYCLRVIYYVYRCSGCAMAQFMQIGQYAGNQWASIVMAHR